MKAYVTAYKKAFYEAYMIACVIALIGLAESRLAVGGRLSRSSQSDGHKPKTLYRMWQGSRLGCYQSIMEALARLSNSCSHNLPSSLHNVYYTKLSRHIEQLHDCSSNSLTDGTTRRLTEQPSRCLYDGSMIGLPMRGTAVRGLEGGGSAGGLAGAAHCQALRNSGIFRVRAVRFIFFWVFQ